MKCPRGLRNSVGNMAQHEYVAGTRLRMLAVELTKRPNLRVSLVTYQDESRDLTGARN